MSLDATDPAALVRRSFDAYRDRDRAALEALLADEFRFTSPYDDGIDRRTYFERCWPGAERIRAFTLERIAVDAEGAFVTYLARTVDGLEFRNTEYHACSAGRITRVDVYFGASYRDGRFVRQAS
jgi:ketosteroid isomerase-like protein